MKTLVIHFQKLDWIMIISALILISLGLLSLYSSSLGKEDFFNFQKQLIFAGIGIFLLFLFSFFDYRVFKNDPHLIFILYILCILGLVGLFFFAPEIRGVKSWYKIGPISIDPIEFTKLVLVLLLAKYFTTRHVEMYRIYHILFSGLYVLVPSILIFLQPDLGSVLILIALWVAILIISGIKLRAFLVLMLCGLLVLALGWVSLLKDYQKERIATFILPQTDPIRTGWSQSQAKIAIGSGSILGQGFGQGSQTQYGFLPEPQTDFIFSTIAEEFGLVGVTVLLSLFLVLIWRIVKIAILATSNFVRLFASGFAVLLISQIFINIGMNLGILPVIGIPLPLISYGGSSLIATLVGLGIIQSIRSRILFHSFGD
jgi:rod shape determining protein RodA